MFNANRTWFRRSHDPWWDLESRAVRRRRRLKTALDIGILTIAIVTLAVTFGTGPAIGF